MIASRPKVRSATPNRLPKDRGVTPVFKGMPELEIESKIVRLVRQIPYGKVSSYGTVARAAGFPRHARRVAWSLRRGLDLPWHRVLGAGGEIKLRGESGMEQRFRLQAEGVSFRGRRVDMALCEFKFRRLPQPRQPGSSSRRRKPGAATVRPA
jgi:methylated-DNA-protein-cysteine methyltransferase-like protein